MAANIAPPTHPFHPVHPVHPTHPTHPTHAGPHLQSVFGAQEIGDLVKHFDFSKMSVRDVTREDYLHIDLAPSYGGLTSEAVKKMDEGLKTIIAGTYKSLEKLPKDDRNWKTIIATFMQNPLLEPDGIDNISRSDKIIKNSSGDFKFDGSPDAGIVREVKSWFDKLISDEDVLRSTMIDINVLARIVAQTGATVDSFESFFAKHEYHEKTMVDIGVLRFPDISHPYFKVYRIQLTAWSDSRRIFFHQEDKNGITGEYNCRRFKPRADIIASLSASVKATAVKIAEDLFADA